MVYNTIHIHHWNDFFFAIHLTCLRSVAKGFDEQFRASGNSPFISSKIEGKVWEANSYSTTANALSRSNQPSQAKSSARKLSAGHKENFFLASPDNNFKLKLFGQIQWRYVYNLQEDTTGNDKREGFELRRTKLGVAGHILNPNWGYKILGNFGRKDGGFDLQSAWMSYSFENGVSIRGGQFKLFLLREEAVKSQNQMLVERSLIDRAFRQGFSQGIEFAYQRKDLRFRGAFSEGRRSANTDALDRNTNKAVTVRFEHLFAGRWKQFHDFTSWSSDDFGLMLGTALHYEVRDDDKPERQTEVIWTSDASVETGGVNLMATVIVNDEQNDDGTREMRWGTVIQSGFLLNKEFELFCRYEHGYTKDATDATDVTASFNIVTGGLNLYFNRHDAKLTLDIGYGFNEVNSFWASAGAGWRKDITGQAGQIVIRTQFQLLF